MSSPARALEVAHLATLSALAGAVVLDPTAPSRRAADYPGWLTGQQRVDRVMSRLAPPLFLSAAVTALAAGVAALVRGRPGLAAGRFAAAGCVVAAVVVTLRVNEPANGRLRGWRPDQESPPDWQDVRARWDRAHGVRRSLVAAAAGVASIVLLLDR